MKHLNRAIFLDRDGVLLNDPGYISDPDQVEVFPDAPGVLREMRAAGWLTIVVTNQAGVAHGYFDLDTLAAIHRRMLRALDGQIDDIYFCPHHVDGRVPEYIGDCPNRKPGPGLLLQAAKDYDIDLGASVMIGDARTDIEAGKLAGCGLTVLLLRHGGENRRGADILARDLWEAWRWIRSNEDV